MKNRTAISIGALLFGVGCGVALRRQRKRTRFTFQGRSVVITGGSRGLGLILARQLARQGARLAILASDPNELKRAEGQLTANGAQVLALKCDVRHQEEVNEVMSTIANRFGGIDVLINNAGIIQVGPLDHMTVKDFEDALAIHLFAPLYCTLAVLPHMRRVGQGRIVNIASIGGKIAVPHLTPYCVSKFALVGLSEGLRAELRQENILVTTVCPGLMRTGSADNAVFKGQHRREYAWFAISAALPGLSVDAERAGRRILKACRRGSGHVVIGLHVRAAIVFKELFPEAATSLAALASRLLPASSVTGSKTAHSGSESKSWLAPRWLTRLNERAALRNNQKS